MLDAAAMDAVRAFMDERDWAQFHSPANLAKSISIEAGELLECFQWSDDADPERVRSELADVLTYGLLLADRLGLDPEAIVLVKLEESRRKYPVDKARGRSPGNGSRARLQLASRDIRSQAPLVASLSTP